MKWHFKRQSIKSFEVKKLIIRGGIEIVPHEKTIVRFSLDYRKFYLYTGGKSRLIGITDTIIEYERNWNYIFK